MKVTTLAFVMPAYDLTSLEEVVPTRTHAVEWHVYEWNYEYQQWDLYGLFHCPNEAGAAARTRHEGLKQELKILCD